jgi:DNA-binding transcriptional ArsR family regulator
VLLREWAEIRLSCPQSLGGGERAGFASCQRITGFVYNRQVIYVFRHLYLECHDIRPAPDALSATFLALADPTRRAILERLAAGAATVKELAAPFEMSGPAVSKHLRVLERAGLVQRGREAQWRPRTLDAAPLKEAAEWAGEFRRFWNCSDARLDAYLLQAGREEQPDDRPG